MHIHQTESLPCDLTDLELRDKGDSLARATEDLRDIADEKKASAESFKLKEDDARGRARRLAKEIRERSEYREVPVEDRNNLLLERVETIRLDTGAVVRSRPMTEAEFGAARQTGLPFVDRVAEDTAKITGGKRAKKTETAPASTASTASTDEP